MSALDSRDNFLWYPSGVMITVNVYVRSLCDGAQFFERIAPGAPLVIPLLRSCAYLIKFCEVNIMQAELTRQFPDTLNRVEVRTMRQKVESIRTLQIANASQKTR